MSRVTPQRRLSWVLVFCVLALSSLQAFAAREEAEFFVSVTVPTSEFFVLPINPGFLEREQVMSYNPVTERLSALREYFDVKNALGGIDARLGFEPVLSNGRDLIPLEVTFNGHRLGLSETLVVPGDEAKAGKRVQLMIAATPPEDAYVGGAYYGSVQVIFDALRP